MNWMYKEEEVTELDIEKYAGFVYIIIDKETGKKYIGKKFITQTRKKPPLKGYKRKRTIITESNWKSYYGSNDELKAQIETYGEERFERTIIHLCKTKPAINQLEIAEQYKHDVLYALLDNGERMYYNNNINGKHYPIAEISDNFMNK